MQKFDDCNLVSASIVLIKSVVSALTRSRTSCTLLFFLLGQIYFLLFTFMMSNEPDLS